MKGYCAAVAVHVWEMQSKRIGGMTANNTREDWLSRADVDDPAGREDLIENVSVAVLIPCFNEGLTIAKVVREFRAALPHATVYVYDNNSSDNTAQEAEEAGAVVRRESLQGKGHVVQRMFADVYADVYVMVDGDATYDPDSAPAMIRRLIDGQLDMVTGVRRADAQEAYRAGHRFGNRLFSSLIARIFGDRVSDLLSGYRVLSLRFVKSFPALSGSFEIETELTVHALELGMPVSELETPYGARPQGSASKLSTYSDGLRILMTVLTLVKNERPLPLFGAISIVSFTTGLILAIPIFSTYLATGLVPRFPTAMLSLGLTIISILSLFAGVILDSVTRGRREIKRLHYLAHPPVPPEGRRDRRT